MEMKRIQAAIEAILFAKGESVEVKDLTEALECSEEEIRQAIDNLKTNYAKADRGIQITELENAIQLRTKEEFYDDLIKVTTVPKKQTLTDAALETLSIVAYKQPVTRLDVEKIRGVNSDSSLNKLLEYGLITEVGRLDAPGKPILFGTTEQFLRSFGVKSIEDLPQVNPDVLEDFKVQAEKEIQIKLDI
ncbi:MAG: SMC-Scp complex subunit ScpB [Lachnospiraceae bacterium]|nr:SMC-Scp complex subunit ScpB [Lachnospiraceae bacterium]